jgi:DNA-binding CsgD family transcriptional regulator
MPQHENWNQCIDRLYDSVGRESELSLALGEFRSFFDARGVTFLTVADMRRPSTSHIGSVGASEASLVDYHSHFASHDEWVLAAYRRPDLGVGSIHRGSELVSRTALRRSYFWKEFLSRYGVADILSVVVELAQNEGPTTFLTFQRHVDQRPFTDRDASQLAALAPHFRNVLRLHRRLAPALALGATLAEVVQRLEVPVLFVAANDSVADTNPAASAALSSANGWIRIEGGRLHAHTLKGWTTVGSALALMRDSVQGSVVLDLVDSGPERRGASLALRAVQGAATDHVAAHPAVAVATLHPGSRNKAQALRNIHGLTPTEARVALQLADGKTANAIARESGVAITTMRTHIASALSKLGLTRQAQLVGRVLRV